MFEKETILATLVLLLLGQKGTKIQKVRACNKSYVTQSQGFNV